MTLKMLLLERLSGCSIYSVVELPGMSLSARTQNHILSIYVRPHPNNQCLSSVAYTAFPLVLIALDAKFSESTSESAARKNLFRYYAQIMELYRTRYDGSDAVAVYIKQVLQLVESEKLRITLHGDKSGKLEHLFSGCLLEGNAKLTKDIIPSGRYHGSRQYKGN